MKMDVLYSVVLELCALHNATVPMTMGHQAHALFLNLIKQFDPALSARLHDEPGSRPFTVSALREVEREGEQFVLRRGQRYSLRVTLLDGGTLWQGLRTHFLEAGAIFVQLGSATLRLTRMLSTPSQDPTGWVCSTDWHALVSLAAAQTITMHFASPTAFSMSKRTFSVLPKPQLLWESLLRVWNLYAPACYRFEKYEGRQDILGRVRVTQCALRTQTLQYPTYTQKGFVGTCTYQIPVQDERAASLTTLAAFARYAGVGYKTTMGMGQAKAGLIPISTP